MKLIYLHQGLGDWLSMASAINQLSQKEMILLPCEAQANKLNNVQHILDGLNIQLMTINKGDDPFNFIEKYNGIGVGWYKFKGATINDFNVKSHYREAYEIIGADYDNRGKFCPIREQVKKVKQLPVPNEPYVFIPEGGSTGNFKVDRKHIDKSLKEIIPPQDAMIFEWADIINNATEIHLHDTSWTYLIDKIDTKGKLFLHIYARPETYLYDYNDILLKQWNLITRA